MKTKIIFGILSVALIAFVSFKSSPGLINAQQAPFPALQISCEPSQDVVFVGAQVTWISTIANASSTVVYSWQGENIQSLNLNQITTSYGSIGEKEATVRAVSNGVTVSATCDVVVVPNINIPNPGGGGGGNNGGGTPTNPGGGNSGGNTGGNSGGGTPTNPGGGGSGNPTNPTNPTNPGGGGAGTVDKPPTTGGGAGTVDKPPTTGGGAGTVDKPTAQKDPMDFTPTSGGAGTVDKATASQCNTQTKPATQARAGIQGSVVPQTGQQMVPTNPVPIVKPIESIEANIAILVEKEIGRADAGGGQTPSLDRIAYCEVDTKIAQAIEKAVTFLYTSNQGGVTFISNYSEHFVTRQDKAFEQTIKKLQQSQAQSCEAEDIKAIADALQKQKMSESFVNSKSSSQQCTVATSGTDKYDLNDPKNLLNYGDPRRNLMLLHLSVENEVNEIITSNTKELEIESMIAQGHYNQVNKQTGAIELPATHYLPQALQKTMLASIRFLEYDEDGEDGVLITEYFNKVYQQMQQNSSGATAV